MTMQTTTIDLLRHGQCEDGHCYRGSSNVSLSNEGWQEMEKSVATIEPNWQRIISSPLRRCADFAQHIAVRHKLTLALADDFCEIHFGDWEGQDIEHIWQTQQAAVMAWWDDPVGSPPPNGEAADIFASRVLSSFIQLIEQYSGEHCLLVGHGGVMRAILTHCLSMPLSALNSFHVPYACLSRLQVFTDAGQHNFQLINSG